MIKKINFDKKNIKFQREGSKIGFENGFLATQTDGSVLLSFDGIEFLALATVNKNPDLSRDFLPLMVDFREMFFAAGKIGGSPYRRKEGRPSDDAVLVSRIIDRCLRPMFPSGMINDVVLTINTFQVDKQTQFQVPAIIASSLALMISGVDFDGPVGAVMIGYVDGEFVINPKNKEKTSMNLVVAGTKESITMIESDGEDISDEMLTEAIEIAQKHIEFICNKQEEFLKQINIKKIKSTISLPSSDVMLSIEEIVNNYEDRFFPSTKEEFQNHYDEIVKESIHKHKEDIANGLITENTIHKAISGSVRKLIRNHVLRTGKRLDGRRYNEVRSLYTEVGLFERLHGTGLFQRGETQVISFTSLGAPGKILLKDTLELDDAEERFMHHYYMLPYSTNESRAYRGQGRREVGHGFLAEKGLRPILPDSKTFPYTIRIVSETLSSNGSSSMASLCASCLSLMDAGVPIKKPVSGIAMGLIMEEINTENEREYSQNKDLKIANIDGKTFGYMILTDLQGQEDFAGDMDFKIAGAKDGINALQMDMKLKGLPSSILSEAIKEGNKAKSDILDFMLKTIALPRENTSDFAPKITTLKLTQDNVRTIIGKGGETIKNIIEKSGVEIDFEDDGTTIISSCNLQDTEKAIKMIDELIWEPEIGDIIEGEITRVESYGVFVGLGSGKVGLCHVRNLSSDFIKDVSEKFKVGDSLRIEVTNIKDDGKVEIKAI